MRPSSTLSPQRALVAAVAVVAVAALVPVAGCTAAADLQAGDGGGGHGAAAGLPDVAAPGAARVPVPLPSPAVAPLPAGATPAARLAPTRSRASAVLHRWDRARAEAFATGDPAALRALYLPGSAAGTADVGALRAYLDRGLRVEGMQMQLLAVRVLRERPGRLRLEVTDRLTGAVAVGPQGRMRLPIDSASTRVVELVRRDGAWLVAGISDPTRRPAAR